MANSTRVVAVALSAAGKETEGIRTDCCAPLPPSSLRSNNKPTVPGEGRSTR